MITDEPRRGWLRNTGLPIAGEAGLSTSPILLAQEEGWAVTKKGERLGKFAVRPLQHFGQHSAAIQNLLLKATLHLSV